MRKVFKVLSVAILSLLVLVGAFLLFAPALFSDSLKSAMINEFQKQTEQDYTLDFSTFDIGIFRRSISVDSLVVQPDSASPHIRKIAASSISVNGIKWFSLFNKSFPDFASITLINPEVELFARDYSASSFSGSGDDLNEEKRGYLTTFNLIIKNGSGKIVREDRTEVLVVDNLSLEAEDVNLNALLFGSELVFLENLSINGSGLKWSLEEKLYAFTIADFSFDKRKEFISLTDIKLTPVVPKYEFSNLRAYQLDRIDLKIPRAELSGFKLDSLSEEHFELDTLKIFDAWMEVFRNKQIDRAPGIATKPLLNKVAHAMDLSFGLNHTLISNATIVYEEHKPPSDTSGSISFNEINASLTNFRTARHPNFHQDTLKLHVESLFMDVAPLTVDVLYPIFDENDTHYLKLKLDSLDPKAVSDMMEHVGFVRIENGFIESLEAEYKLNAESSTGEVLVLYRDLKVSFLNKDDPNSKNIFQWAGDLIANTFVIKSKNTGDDPRIGEIDFEREKEKSIFAYWWKSLLSGLKNSIK
ncbi:MAG: hypothetical protein WD022_11005 [Balneolaceae bacterium]